jgi:hypothetical protein
LAENRRTARLYQGVDITAEQQTMLHKWRIGGALLAVLMTASLATAQDKSPLSPADFNALLGYVDSIGLKQSFQAPMAKNLGLSQDEKQDLPVTCVVTNDHKIYFCRNGLDAKDYLIWVIGANQKSSTMYVTHKDLKLSRALSMHAKAVPQLENIEYDTVLTAYKKALAGLSQDLHRTATH